MGTIEYTRWHSMLAAFWGSSPFQDGRKERKGGSSNSTTVEGTIK